MRLRDYSDELKPVLSRLPAYVGVARSLLLDRRLSNRRTRALVGCGLTYLLSPIDVIPGFLPVVGQLDDLLAALLTVRLALDTLPGWLREEVLARSGLHAADVDEDLNTLQNVLRELGADAGFAAGRAAGLMLQGVGQTVSWVATFVTDALDRLVAPQRVH